MTRLLIIEDNPELVANLYAFFEPIGYVLDDARDGASGLRRATQHDYDAILLDLMLPRLDGMTLCRAAPEFQNPVPILMLTARDPVEDACRASLGADDYLVKPFSLKELDARIKALVRRAQGRQVDSVLAWKDLQVDTRRRAWRRCRADATSQLMPGTRGPAVVQAGDGIPGLGRRAGQRRAAYPSMSCACRWTSFDTTLIATVHSVGWRMPARTLPLSTAAWPCVPASRFRSCC